MALGGRGQRAAEDAIARCRPFRSSTGNLRGTRGPTTQLGWLSSHPDARKIRELLGKAVYVVWSYGTPIGFVTEDEDGDRTSWFVDESHSSTTSHHQTLCRLGLGEFETIGEGPWSRSAPRGRRDGGMPPLDFSDRPHYVSETARGLVRERPQTASVTELGNRLHEQTERFVTNRRGVRYDSLVERDTSFERDMVEERQREARERAMEVGAVRAEQGYMTPRERDAWGSGHPTREQMLDPRYSDPDWTPWRSNGSNLPPGADIRDEERIEREGRRTL